MSILLTAVLLAGCVQNEAQTVTGPPTIEKKIETNTENERRYGSKTTKENCTLCSCAGGTLLPAYWGEDNIGVIDLNKFQLAHIEINPYEDCGNYKKEDYGRSSTSILNTGEGGLSIWGTADMDRGYYTGEVAVTPSNVLDLEQMSQFLCTECINSIVPYNDGEEYFNIGIINFKTQEIRLLQKEISMFFLGDFYIGCDYQEREWDDRQEQWFELLVFYCPQRFTK
ncbi:hypothetical protein V3C10_07130 [[Clostridium] symbiosum]|uniref:hypothetical protein n=1 Tax=Clostridium symbiosum TaxID=1512 RepID=UPI001D08B5F1|nr:hypothetical protein [[Clostridium] symbiosum]MCB6607145.1 hypothetical protein [[Clostridium] symbiosum]MCB6929705.1 hypothetical protein [[Clostridium] symbiosum]